MEFSSGRLRLLAGSMVLAAGLPLGPAEAAVVYSQTIVNAQAVATNVAAFTNCVDSQGCLGDAGLVFDAVGNPVAANLPDTISYAFTLNAAQIAAVAAAPGGTATLTMTAARDIGAKAGTTNVDFLVSSVEGTFVGNLFEATIDTCPAGENILLTCGPNFHNDLTATTSINFSSLLFQTAAADGTLSLLVDPTEIMGRLKIFSVGLEYSTAEVPEPSSLLLLGVGLAGLGLVLTRRRNDRPGA